MHFSLIDLQSCLVFFLICCLDHTLLMEIVSKLERPIFRVQGLPSSKERKTDVNKVFHTYCVKLESLDIIDQEIDVDCFQAQATIFDQKYKKFVGSFWKGKPVPIKNKKAYFNQSLYFYSSIPGKELILVVELLEADQSIAWMCIPLVDKDESSNALEVSLTYKTPLLRGSPLSLLVLDRNSKNFSLLDHVTGMELSLLLMPFPLVLQIAHLVPENVLVDTSDLIPGVVPNTVDSFKPHLQKCLTYVLSGICVRIHPLIKEFEKSIFEKILKQQQDSGCVDLESTKAEIIQRRLQVGVHNGYTFIQECDIYHLLVEPIVTPKAHKTHQRSSSMGSINYSRETGLTLRSDVKMPNVPDDPNIALVFLVEYTISLPTNSNRPLSAANSISKSPTTSVSIAWGHAKLGNVRANPSQTVPLACDSIGSPFGVLFLKLPDILELSFTASIHQKQNKNMSVGPVVGDYGSVASFSTKTYISPETSYLHSPATSVPGPMHKSVGDIPMSVNQNEVENQRVKELDTHMQEVTLISTSLPLVPPMLHSFPTESNSPFSKLYWDQLIPVLDHRGTPATVLSLPYTISKQLELSSPPQQNECSMQFLAISGLEESSQIPSDVFFTFQFYRFLPVRTESLVLKPLSDNDERYHSSKVFALMKLRDVEKSLGFQVTYKVDPSELGNEEYKPFLSYLMKHTLHIDLWNGQSLLYFGTVLLPLKYFCRQGKDAVCVTLELDIVDCEFPDESLGQASLSPAVRKGKLHLLLSNVRHPLSAKSLEKLQSKINSDSVTIRPKNSSGVTAPIVSKARPVIETNRELTHLLATRSTPNEKSIFISEERRRKLARMEAVLNLENEKHNVPSVDNNLQHFLKEREQDLLTIETYIQRNKSEMIESLLHASVTQERTIYPIIGSKAFFEFALENPFPESKKVNILWKSPELSLVTDLKLWQALRGLHGLSQQVEPISFSKDASLILKPKEQVHIPFTFYSSLFIHHRQLEVFKTSSGHHFTSDMLSSAPVPSNLMPKTVKLRFVTEDQVLLSFLILNVQPLLPSPSHIFKFLSMEHSMFKKLIRVEQSDSGRLSASCSDSEATCCLQENWEEDTSIQVKAPTKAAGQFKEFYVFLYKEKQYQICPFQVWHVTICPLQRIDLSCVAGQLMRSSLLIRGSHVTHLVQCFSSSSNLQLHPSEPFLLAPFTPHELSLNVRPLLPGTRHFQITMVNQSLELVLQSWLLVLSCQKPTISKAFQVHLNVGTEVTKRITYTNPYNQERHFVLHSSHPHLLRLWERRLSVGPGESYPLGLHFLPQDHIFTETIFVYLNDEKDKNEDTYCIKVNCQ